MDTETIKQLINASLQGAETTITGQGGKFEAQVISDVFAGLNTLQRHRKVYACLSQHIDDGSIHALSIKTYTLDEYSKANNC